MIHSLRGASKQLHHVTRQGSPQPPGGTCSDSRCLPGSQSAWTRHPGPRGLLLFTTAPGRAISDVASCFYYKWQGKVFNLSNWTRKYKVQLNFIFFNRSIVNLQHCISFFCTEKFISYTFTHIHLLLDSFPK